VVAVRGEEPPDDVFGFPVGGRRGGDSRGFGFAVVLPFEATADRPRQDAGRFVAELLGEIAVLVTFGEDDVPVGGADTAPHGMVGAADARPVVRGEPDRPGRVDLPAGGYGNVTYRKAEAAEGPADHEAIELPLDPG
jgi:hypothetical protein